MSSVDVSFQSPILAVAVFYANPGALWGKKNPCRQVWFLSAGVVQVRLLLFTAGNENKGVLHQRDFYVEVRLLRQFVRCLSEGVDAGANGLDVAHKG